MTDLNTAIRYFQICVDGTPQNHPQSASRLEYLGAAYHDRYRETDNIADLRSALETRQACIKQTPLGHPEIAGRLYDLGTGYHERYLRLGDIKDLELAIEGYQQAVEAIASPVWDRTKAAMELIPVYVSINRLREAYSIGQKATRLVPMLAPWFLKNDDKQHLLAKVIGLASESAALALYVANDPFDAIQLLECGRGVISRFLTDMRTNVTALSTAYPALGIEFQRLRDLLISSAPSPNGKDFSSSSNDRYDAQLGMEKLLSVIQDKHGFEELLLAPKREDVQSAAAKGPIVIVNVTQYRCDAILIEQHAIRSVPLFKLNYRDIEEKTRAGDLGSYKTLCWMWDTIAKPVLEALSLTSPPSDGKFPRIWWIPTGLLVKFPLHAAGRHQENSSETVLDRAISSYSSSINAILHQRANQCSKVSQPELPRALLIAVPNATGCSSLPFAIEELNIVREICTSMAVVPVEPQCRRFDVVSHLPQCKIFHFAGHGLTDVNDPSQSFLLLEDWTSDPLTVAELIGLDIQGSSAFLAYLSACGTGQIRNEKLIDEGIHLISAFQLIGFRHVIGTLREVGDKACVDVAQITYEGIRNGHMTDDSVSLGLHNAIRKIRDDWLSACDERRESSQQPDNQDTGHEARGQIPPARDAVICEDNTATTLSWVQYVHYGV